MQTNYLTMDKIAMNNAINYLPAIHPLPKGIRDVHRRYGLWICKFIRGNAARPTAPKSLPLRRFEFYDLSHMYDGCGWFCAGDGKLKEVKKGDGILVAPGFQHNYGGLKEAYVEDAISFCGPLADYLLETGIIKSGIFRIGKARRLLSVIELALDHSDNAQIMANIELQKLLMDLYLENKNLVQNKDAVFEQLLGEIRKAPGKYWSLDVMTEFCNISISQLNRLFKKETGMTSKNYIDSIRMDIAAEMLASSTASIKQIAKELGYPDPYHFSRRFKEIKGYAPMQYKELFLR